MSEKLKIGVFCARGLEEFILPIIGDLRKDHEVRLSHGQAADATAVARWADVVWLEWGNELAQKMTQAQGILDDRYTILRVHSYEIFAGMLPKIRWSVVDHLVCPTRHTLELAINESHMGDRALSMKMNVIHTGINLASFKYKPREHGDNIGFVARLNHKKGIQLMLQVARQHPGGQFHIVGEWQDLRFKHYFDHITSDMDNVHFHGWLKHEDMPEFLDSLNYILCTSPFESQGMGLMEGMARGIKPLVHNFPGAAELYPEDCLWNDLLELDEIIEEGEYNSKKYRTHIEKNFSTKLSFKKVRAILPGKDDLKKIVGGPGSPLSSVEPNAQKKGPVDLPNVAFCLMFGNEEKNIGRCIKSIKPFADLVVAMDTGSTDKTREIIENWGGVEYRHPGDSLEDLFTETNQGKKLMFGPARNKLLEMVPEYIDWIFMIDCDEEFSTQWTKEQFKSFLASVPKKYNAVALLMKDMQDGRVVMTFNSNKIFRRGTVQYRGIVHNEPVYDGPTALMQDAFLFHYGYDLTPEEKTAKAQRTIGLLDKRIEENPNDWKAYFYKGQAIGYFQPENVDDIIECTKAYVENRGEVDDFNQSAYFTLIKALMNKGDVQESWAWIMRAKAALPDDLDISMAMVEFGIWTKNDPLIISSSQEFIRIYDLYDTEPSKKGGRFIYSHNQESLIFVNFYSTSALLKKGAVSLAQFQELMKFVPQDQKVNMMKELNRVLEKVGVSLLPSQEKTTPQNVH